jgi:hypothetical protein
VLREAIEYFRVFEVRSRASKLASSAAKLALRWLDSLVRRLDSFSCSRPGV